MNLIIVLTIISASLFFIYGLQCLFSRKMVVEFERYQLPQFRKLIGVLEVIGGIGQLLGIWLAPVGFLASLGLTLLMICGVWARWRIKDPVIAFLPAVLLGLLNGVLAWRHWQNLG